MAAAVGVPFAPISEDTRQRLAVVLDPGLEPGNPLDVWRTGRDPEALFTAALSALAAAARLRDSGIPVLESTRTGLRALAHLLAHPVAHPGSGMNVSLMSLWRHQTHIHATPRLRTRRG